MSALTADQLAVLQLLAGGLRDSEIAAELYISLRMVKVHTNQMRTALGARTNAQAVAIACNARILAVAPADALPVSVILGLLAQALGYEATLTPRPA